MSIWTRIAEVIAEVGGSVVQALQRLVGPANRQPEHSIAFTIGMIALSAKMAKADGVVSEREIAAFRRVFHVPQAELPHVARVFNYARQDVAGYDAYARQIARMFKSRPEMLEDVLDGLFHIATADGVVHEAEIRFLTHVAEIFGFDARAFRRIQGRHVRGLCGPCEVLGLAETVSDEELRRRYRELVKENHPDRHIAAGMPAEMVDIATARLAAINAAYEQLAKERGL